MPDSIKEVAHALPFMLPAAGALNLEGGQTVNKTRVLEAVIIAALVGLLSVGGAWFLLIPELKTEFKYIARDVSGLQSGQESIRLEFKTLDNKVDSIQLETVRDRFTRTDYQDHLQREHSGAP